MALLAFSRQVLIWGFISWLLPLFVSFFLIDPVTKEYLINYWVFKGLMLAILAGVLVFSYRSLQMKAQLTTATANTFLLMNVLGDCIVLLLLFRMDWYLWLTTIAPIYPLTIYGVFLMMRKATR